MMTEVEKKELLNAFQYMLENGETTSIFETVELITPGNIKRKRWRLSLSMLEEIL